MLACVLGPGGPALRADWRPPPRPGEARVRLLLGGVCATDLELIRGYKSFAGVLGHEFVGRVEEAPDPRWIGRRVVGSINCPCRACALCRDGRANHCRQRSALGIVGRDGAFAESFWLPLDNLHEVPESVPDAAAVFCEPLAAALRVLEQVHVRPGWRVGVLGLGRLGRLCVQVLTLTPAEVWALGRRPEQHADLPAGVRPALVEAPGLPRFDLLVDATGSPAGLEQAARLLAPCGRLVLKSSLHGHGDLPIGGVPWVVDELCLLGSRCGPLDAALRLLAEGRIDPRPLITARYPLREALRALDHAARPGTLKVLLEGE